MADPQPFDPWGDLLSLARGSAARVDDVADSDLARLAAGFLEPDAAAAPDRPGDLDPPAAGGPARPGGAAAGGDLVLALEEVVGDGNGEVVFFNEAGLARLTLQTDSAVVGQGTATGHAPVDGEDVNGFAFVSFESGLTLYYPEGLDLALAPVA